MKIKFNPNGWETLDEKAKKHEAYEGLQLRGSSPFGLEVKAEVEKVDSETGEVTVVTNFVPVGYDTAFDLTFYGKVVYRIVGKANVAVKQSPGNSRKGVGEVFTNFDNKPVIDPMERALQRQELRARKALQQITAQNDRAERIAKMAATRTKPTEDAPKVVVADAEEPETPEAAG